MSRTISNNISVEPDDLSPTSPHIGILVGNRYQVLRSLDKRQGVERLLAVDKTRDELVIVKALPDQSVSGGTAMRLEYAVAALREVKGTYLAPLLDVKQEANWLYLIYPFIPGITLWARLDQGRIGLIDALTIGKCLFSALKEVHHLRMLHGDIRPRNVIVEEKEPLTRAVLINFDLAYSMLREISVDSQSLEEALYWSPEQAGSLDYDVGAPSELYSAGVLLFECLVGSPPYQGGTVGEILLQHMTAHAPELRSLRADVPRALDELVQRLLRKDPRDRYQSAEAVLVDLQGISDALNRGEREPSLVVGSRDRRPTLTEPAFVGRFPELEQLEAQIRLACEGRGSLVIVESESGGGKTRLLEEVALRGAQKGMRVFHGQGSEQVGLRPFQV
ncbi:MAG TPA: protein kinase, partial [Thermoguttaceae bacterium]